MVGPPFRCTSMPYFVQVLLKLSLSPWWYGAVMCGIWFMLLLSFKFLLLLLIFFGAGVWLLILTLLRAHGGYLHFFKLLYRCSRTNKLLEDKLLADFHHGFFWSEENVIINQINNPPWVVIPSTTMAITSANIIYNIW